MKHTYSLVHLTNIACSPPAFIRTAAAAGYDAVSLRTIPMGLPGEVPHDITDRKLRAETLRQASGSMTRKMRESMTGWTCIDMSRTWKRRRSWGSGMY